MHKSAPLTLLHKLKGGLDLEPILVKAMDAEEGYGWTLNFARRVAEEYGRFLVLCFEHKPDASHCIIPSGPVADFWRLHILDTEKYIQDCQRCFGAILHRSTQDGGNLQEAWLSTVALYRSTFGKPPADIWPWLSPAKPALASFDQGVEGGNSSHGISNYGVSESKTVAGRWILKDLDLEPIIAKAMDAEQRNGWNFYFTSRVAEEYRRFLVLCLERQQDTSHLIVPSKRVDTFWHLHILDTRKYIEDCQYCFGSVLHHFPYFGMRGNQDSDNLQEAYGQTLALYWWAFAMAAPVDIWPGSKTALEPVRTQFGLPLLNHWGEGGSRFDRTRPRLAGQAVSTDSSTKQVVPSQPESSGFYSLGPPKPEGEKGSIDVRSSSPETETKDRLEGSEEIQGHLEPSDSSASEMPSRHEKVSPEEDLDGPEDSSGEGTFSRVLVWSFFACWLIVFIAVLITESAGVAFILLFVFMLSITMSLIVDSVIRSGGRRRRRGGGGAGCGATGGDCGDGGGGDGGGSCGGGGCGGCPPAMVTGDSRAAGD